MCSSGPLAALIAPKHELSWPNWRAVFSWGVTEQARGRVKRQTDVPAKLGRLNQGGPGVAHCNLTAPNMEQYARLPRNSVDGHRGAEVALRRLPSICEGGRRSKQKGWLARSLHLPTAGGCQSAARRQRVDGDFWQVFPLRAGLADCCTLTWTLAARPGPSAFSPWSAIDEAPKTPATRPVRRRSCYRACGCALMHHNQRRETRLPPPGSRTEYWQRSQPPGLACGMWLAAC